MYLLGISAKVARTILSVIVFGVCSMGAKADDAAGRDIVLVHGAWVGEWYWSDLVAILKSAGHRPHAVSLKGHGQRRAEGGPKVSIADHAADIISAVEQLKMEDIILVGHSYGGRPLTAAWDTLREEIAHVVYVESVAPVNDDSIAIPKDHKSMRFIMERYPALVEQGMLPVPARLKQSYSQVLASQSIKSVYGEVTLGSGPLPDTPGTYVVGKESKSKIFRSYGKHLEIWRGWNFTEISGGHSLAGVGMRDLADVLQGIAEGR
ncbi:MAG: alpha/beta hydrolase [Cognatishimia sp.]|uniref:alpha/beta hydrolase n=1 Tax=Cognatishimia sp. TaxID=2211648 RepID=UPI003B8AF174